MEIITYVIIGAICLSLMYLVIWWIKTYNKFHYWIEKTRRKFSDIDVVMQQRIDMLPALAQAVKKYDIHEYKALKDVIEARSRWTKDAPVNEKAKTIRDIDNAYIKIQVLFEKYPKLQSSVLHSKLMGKGSIAKMESILRKFRLSYNKTIQKYNRRVKIFPRNIVAKAHGFHEIEYLSLGNRINKDESIEYDGKKLFED